MVCHIEPTRVYDVFIPPGAQEHKEYLLYWESLIQKVG